MNLPFQARVQQVQYKAELAGITVILASEAYASKCSFLDGEKLPATISTVAGGILPGSGVP